MDKQEHKRFWEQLNIYASGRTDLHATIAPRPQTAHTAAVAPGVVFMYEIHLKKRAAQILFRSQDRATNKAIYDFLASQRREIDAAFGPGLGWYPEPQVPGYKSAYIGRYWEHGQGIANRPAWPEYQRAMVETMIKLEEVLRPYLKEYLGSKYRQGKG
jgi:hypothetical protein